MQLDILTSSCRYALDSVPPYGLYGAAGGVHYGDDDDRCAGTGHWSARRDDPLLRAVWTSTGATSNHNRDRQYSPDALQRLRFIKRDQRFGFTLADIAELLRMQFEADLSCDEWERRAVAKIGDIERKISDLTAMKDGLLALVASCREGCEEQCTVLLDPPFEATMSQDGTPSEANAVETPRNPDTITKEAG
jgi:DNA-binding transcriptional MerR regulator